MKAPSFDAQKAQQGIEVYVNNHEDAKKRDFDNSHRLLDEIIDVDFNGGSDDQNHDLVIHESNIAESVSPRFAERRDVVERQSSQGQINIRTPHGEGQCFNI